MSCITSVSAPSTPTEQVKQIHPTASIKKSKRSNKVHFPNEENLVTCYIEAPDPWSKDYGNTIESLTTSYMAACDKQGIQPFSCVLDQLQEYEKSSYKLESYPRAFDLSILGEKLSLRHVEALEEVLRRLQFNLVDLEGCYLEDEGAAAFFDIMEYYDSAVQLNISFTKHIDCRGWQACSRMLKKSLSLVHLNARSTVLHEQVLLIVGKGLRLGSNLVTLHLENCGIYGRCMVVLVAALKMNTILRELFLAENKITSADGFHLGNLLRTNTHLELIDLSNNKLGDEGLIHVMESISQQSNTSGRGLSTLILWNNELTIKGIPCIAKALTAARALRKINLGSNDITDAGVSDLKQSFICNRTIEILELENANISTDGAFALAEYISQNQFIQTIDICGNDIRLPGLEALVEAVGKSQNIVSLKIDATSKDLREPLTERQDKLQEITKFCQRNKEAKKSLPPQDAQLSILFNGIFSHVLPISPASETPPVTATANPPQNFLRGRFHVSVVSQPDNDLKSPRSISLDPGFLPVNGSDLESSLDHEPEPLVGSRVKWMEGLGKSESNSSCSCKVMADALVEDDGEVFLPEERPKSCKPCLRKGLSFDLGLVPGSSVDLEPKVRRLSSPTGSVSAPRKTHSIKCCKELEGLDLRSTVPLSPTRLHESFDFPEPQSKEVPMSSQINLKSSTHAVYMVH